MSAAPSGVALARGDQRARVRGFEQQEGQQAAPAGAARAEHPQERAQGARHGALVRKRRFARVLLRLEHQGVDVPHAERVMERLGVAHHFEAIFDIAAGDYWPKPHKQIYEKLVTRHGVDPTRACMADDIAVNLKPAGEMGMRTVWIRTDETKFARTRSRYCFARALTLWR